MSDQASPADTEELLGREVGVVDESFRVDHHDRFRKRVEDRGLKLLVERPWSLERL
jgi:hypothetical protein